MGPDSMKLVQVDQIWQHHSGKMYMIVAVANTTATKPGWEPTVCYRALDSNDVYARSLESFLTRMKKVM